MSSCITVETSIGQADWNGLVDRVPWATAQQRYAYAGALGDSFGFLRPVYSLFRSDGVAVAGLPLFRFAPFGPFRALYSLPFDMYGGPLIDPAHLRNRALLAAIRRQIEREAESFNAFEIGLSVPPHCPDATIGEIFGSDDVSVERRSCPVLDLDRPLDEIVGGFKPAVKRAIAKCHRSGVTIEVDPPLEALRQAFPIYRERMRTLGATAKPWAFVERVVRAGLAIGFVAKREGQPLGLVILLVSGAFSIYWLSAMDPAAVRLRITNGLVDRVIRWSHERKITHFSMGESHGMGPGIMRFKMGWGPDLRESRHVIKICRPRVRHAWRALEPTARGAYGIWAHARQSASKRLWSGTG